MLIGQLTSCCSLCNQPPIVQNIYPELPPLHIYDPVIPEEDAFIPIVVQDKETGEDLEMFTLDQLKILLGIITYDSEIIAKLTDAYLIAIELCTDPEVEG